MPRPKQGEVPPELAEFLIEKLLDPDPMDAANDNDDEDDPNNTSDAMMKLSQWALKNA
jgi:hypothetical protein